MENKTQSIFSCILCYPLYSNLFTDSFKCNFFFKYSQIKENVCINITYNNAKNLSDIYRSIKIYFY